MRPHKSCGELAALRRLSRRPADPRRPTRHPCTDDCHPSVAESCELAGGRPCCLKGSATIAPTCERVNEKIMHKELCQLCETPHTPCSSRPPPTPTLPSCCWLHTFPFWLRLRLKLRLRLATGTANCKFSISLTASRPAGQYIDLTLNLPQLAKSADSQFHSWPVQSTSHIFLLTGQMSSSIRNASDSRPRCKIPSSLTTIRPPLPDSALSCH